MWSREVLVLPVKEAGKGMCVGGEVTVLREGAVKSYIAYF